MPALSDSNIDDFSILFCYRFFKYLEHAAYCETCRVQDSQGVSASEMTYIVSGGALNSTHSLVMSIFCYVTKKQLALKSEISLET